MIRAREIWREAWLNTVAGVSRPVTAVLLFILTVGTIACVQTLAVVTQNRDAQDWRTSGASVQILTLEAGIDGAACNALARTAGVSASGAVRSGATITFAALPSTRFTTFEATGGIFGLLQSTGPVTHQPWGGLMLSSDLAEVLGVTGGQAQNATLSDGEQTDIAGVYFYPEDGRLPILGYNAVSIVPPVGLFDACWVEIWPESQALDSLLTLSIAANEGTGPDRTPEIRQLNSTRGLTFDPDARWMRLPTWILIGAGVLFAAILSYGLTRARRLELASALHAGVDKISVVLQTTIEAAIWLLPAALFSAAAALWCATASNPDPPWSAFVPGLRLVAISGLVVLGTSALTSLTVREAHLFRYFRNR